MSRNLLRTLICGLALVTASAPAAVEEAKEQIEKAKSELDREIFEKETRAQEAEISYIVPLWNRLLEAEDKFSVLAEADFETITLMKPAANEEGVFGIRIQNFEPGGPTMTPEEWAPFAAAWRDAGFVLTHTEWHQSSYEEPEDAAPRSVFSFKMHGIHERVAARFRIKGDAEIVWKRDGPGGTPTAKDITVKKLAITLREGPLAFERKAIIDPGIKGIAVGTLLVYDVDRNGLSDIIISGLNRVMWNRGDWQFETERFCQASPGGFHGALLADFNGDGVADLFTARLDDPMEVYLADSNGKFVDPPLIVGGVEPLKTVTCSFSAGDIDGDGDLDVYVGQYRDPYGDDFPTDFHDANDGYPDTLLVNDGQGNFTDQTKERGLQEKRFRRTYSASFVDLDEDEDLDLMVVSDFSGVDVYLNDGTGHFTDATSELVDNRSNFGMSHNIEDYDGDGHLDFLVIGMSSTTARRLTKMNARRDETDQIAQMRMPMGYGNRMYLSSQGMYRQPDFNDTLARTGWSWGTTSFDLENDGDRDIFIANGNVSGKTTQDYCSTFWRHDIYLAQAGMELAHNTYLSEVITPKLCDISWDGFQANCLLINQGEKGFEEWGFLLDIGEVFDARRTVSTDLDNDGLVDVVVHQFGEPGEVNEVRESTFKLYGNNLESARENNWIGVRLHEYGDGYSPMGARIVVNTPNDRLVAWNVSGDSFRSQHPNTKHFGLGKGDAVKSIEVHWPNGKTTILKNPAVNEYHTLEPAD